MCCVLGVGDDESEVALFGCDLEGLAIAIELC